VRLESTRNERLRAAFSLNRSRERRHRRLSLLEGSRIILDCLDIGASLMDVFLDETLDPQSFEQIAVVAQASGAQVFSVAAGVLQRLSDQERAEGAAATVRIPETTIEEVLGQSPLVVCDGIQNPGNLGAIVRTSAALGAGAVIGSGGSDPFGPKALRGAAGASFVLPIATWNQGLESLIQALAQAGYRIVIAETRGGAPHRGLRPAFETTALILGSEGKGLTSTIENSGRAIERVTVQLHGRVESLNVAVAAGILLDRLMGPD